MNAPLEVTWHPPLSTLGQFLQPTFATGRGPPSVSFAVWGLARTLIDVDACAEGGAHVWLPVWMGSQKDPGRMTGALRCIDSNSSLTGLGFTGHRFGKNE